MASVVLAEVITQVLLAIRLAGCRSPLPATGFQILKSAPPWLSGLGWQLRLRQFSNPLGKPAVPKVPGVCRRSLRTPHAPKGSRRPASGCPWGDGLSEECCGHSAWLLVLLREERRGLVWFGFGNLCSPNLLASGGSLQELSGQLNFWGILEGLARIPCTLALPSYTCFAVKTSILILPLSPKAKYYCSSSKGSLEKAWPPQTPPPTPTDGMRDSAVGKSWPPSLGYCRLPSWSRGQPAASESSQPEQGRVCADTLVQGARVAHKPGVRLRESPGARCVSGTSRHFSRNPSDVSSARKRQSGWRAVEEFCAEDSRVRGPESLAWVRGRGLRRRAFSRRGYLPVRGKRI
ncbi:hypothetical protein ACRRTK_001137 [Alexandromys fortis]